MYTKKSLATGDFDCPIEQLEWFVNQTLNQEEHEAVERHLQHCEHCQQDIAELMALRGALHIDSERMPLPRADLFHQIEQHIDAGIFSVLLRQKLQHLSVGFNIVLQHLTAQCRLIRRDLLWMPLLILPLAAFLAGSSMRAQERASMLAFVAAFITALCMAFLYGREADPAREITLVTTTSPRLILCMRCCMIFGYDLLINLIGVLPFLLLHSTVTPAWFLTNWLAPLCCLAAISLLLSVLLHPAVAIVLCSLLWILRAMSDIWSTRLIHFATPLQGYEQLWHSEGLLFGIAALAICLTFLFLERREHFTL